MMRVAGRNRSTMERTKGLIAGLVTSASVSPIMENVSKVSRTSPMNSCNLLGAMESCASSP